MRIYCRYHPKETARWHCDGCVADLCAACAQIRTDDDTRELPENRVRLCPICRAPLRWIGVSNIIEPFWRRLPAFFRYPLYGTPLCLIWLIAVTAGWMGIPEPTGKVVRILCAVALFKYAFSVLQTTAGGNLTPPGFNTLTLFRGVGLVIKQYLLIFFLFFTAGFFVRVFEPSGGIILAVPAVILLIFLFPAMLIILAVTERLSQALNPFRAAEFIRRIGGGYLLMFFFLFLIGTAPAAAWQAAAPVVPPLITPVLYRAMQAYYTLIAYHLMGYVILQYHGRLGYRIEFEDFREHSTAPGEVLTAGPESRIIEGARIRIREGDFEGAIRWIQEKIDVSAICDPQLAETYFKLLQLRKKAEALTAFAPTYLELLVREGDRQLAPAIFRLCLANNPSFSPAPGTALKVSAQMSESGDPEEAVRILQRLIRTHPKDPAVPGALFKAATLFHHRLRRPEKAKAILRTIVKKYPQSQLTPAAMDYLNALNRKN